MSLFNIFDISGSGMSAQSVRLNTVSSNLANVETVSGTEEGAYRSRQPIFQTVLDNEFNDRSVAKVEVMEVIEKDAPPTPRYQPGHPLANDDGYVFMPNVNAMEELANMISASRNYQNNVEVLSTSKDLMLRTLNMGK